MPIPHRGRYTSGHASMVVTYSLLTLAILTVWVGGDDRPAKWRSLLWLFPFAAACVTALGAGILQPIGALWLALFAAAVGLWQTPTLPRAGRGAALGTLLLLATGLMTHQLPGYNNPLAIPLTRLTPDALPYRLHLNFDKTAAGLLLLALLRPRLYRLGGFATLLRRTAPVALGLMTLLLVMSVAAGYVRFDPKFPPQAPLWLWANLCLTCMAEEALFRGFIQARLQAAWAGHRHGAWAALLVAAVLFGLAHAGGGPTYIVLSTVAGVGYGWAFLRTGRIEASILTHFALNAVHFVGFTYPALAR